MTGISGEAGRPAANGPVVPQDITRVLRRIIRRARAVIVVKGCCAVAAAALGSMLAAMAVDAGVTLFASWPRWVLSLSALA